MIETREDRYVTLDKAEGVATLVLANPKSATRSRSIRCVRSSPRSTMRGATPPSKWWSCARSGRPSARVTICASFAARRRR